MRILVCMKQVPDTMEIRLKEETGTLDRGACESVMNPFDLYALEAAARLQDAWNEKPCDSAGENVEGVESVTALSMGMAGAKTILRDALALCANEAYLVSDEWLAGADLHVTAQALFHAIRFLEEKDGPFDLICMGRASTDGGSGVLPSMLAALLDRPCVTNVISCGMLNVPSDAKRQAGSSNTEGQNISPDTTSGRARKDEEKQSGDIYCVLHAEQEGEQEDNTWEIQTPCVLSFTKASYPVCYPDFARLLEAEHSDIPVLSLQEIGMEEADMAPFTKVRAFRYHPVKKAGHVLNGSPETVAEKLTKALKESGVL